MARKRTRLRSFLTVELPLIAIILFAIGPYVWMFITSVKPESELFTSQVIYWTAHPTLASYERLFQHTGFLGNLVDSLIVASFTVMVGLSLSVTAAYAFSRFRFPGRRLLMMQFLLINMFPIVLLIIPLFIIMRWFGLLDTYPGLIIAHSTFSIPFATWMMTSYMNAIPVSLDEAAMTDGCSRLGALWRVILPLCRPGVAATGIYIFITSWNEYLYAMTLTVQNVRTITVAIQTLIGEFEIAWGLLTAGGVIGALPATVLFMLVQRHLIGGLTRGAVKG